jgi:hypothetical protein
VASPEPKRLRSGQHNHEELLYKLLSLESITDSQLWANDEEFEDIVRSILKSRYSPESEYDYSEYHLTPWECLVLNKAVMHHLQLVRPYISQILESLKASLAKRDYGDKCSGSMKELVRALCVKFDEEFSTSHEELLPLFMDAFNCKDVDDVDPDE